LIFLSALVPIVQTVEDYRLAPEAFFALSTTLDAFFLLEVGIRWAVCPSFLGFLRGFYNIMDLAFVIPFALRIATFDVTTSRLQSDGASEAILMCIVPTLRVLKALRNLENFSLLVHTLAAVSEPLSVPICLLCVVVTVFSSILFVLEPRENLESMPHSMWMVFVTVSTVGYGDRVPVTAMGRMVTTMVIIMGMLCLAMPITIVGQAFTAVWRDRVRILILGQMRARLHQWRYTEEDLKKMFNHFDLDGSGELDVDEFHKMTIAMRLGLNEASIRRTFEAFDIDGSGSIDVVEFLGALAMHAESKSTMALF
jgi:hypothetical protein